MDKIKIKSITYTFKEGFCHHNDAMPLSFPTWREAEAQLRARAWEAPANGCYDKLDFVIEWQDGQVYKGRYDVKHPDVEPPNLSGHILDLAGFYMGKHRPTHMSASDYERYITGAGAAVGKSYAALVETYSLADA